MRILFVAAEFAPYVRTGGLGNAVAGLAHAVAADHEVTVAIPGYRDADMPGRKVAGRPWRRHREGNVEVLFWLDESFDRPGVYGPDPSSSYDDNWERFARFSVAVSELAGEFDVIHLHDGHVGAIALTTSVPSVFTIHNASYPMIGPLGPSIEIFGLSPKASVMGGDMEWFGEANYLKAGIVGATQATTVSPGHARELNVDALSFGLGGIIRGLFRPILGVVNGIDTDDWDPKTDPMLPKPFSAADLTGRSASRAALLKHVRPRRRVFARQCRVGCRDRRASASSNTISQRWWTRVPDSSSWETETWIALVDSWVERHPKAVVHVPFDEPASRLIFAGSDAYLMPSQYEPCGLGQIYAMRYGSPPIAHFTGGLEDTVFDIDEDPTNGTGFVFRSFDHPSLTKTIRRAMRYRLAMPGLWNRIQTNGMTYDWSWSARATEYEAIYESVLP